MFKQGSGAVQIQLVKVVNPTDMQTQKIKIMKYLIIPMMFTFLTKISTQNDSFLLRNTYYSK